MSTAPTTYPTSRNRLSNWLVRSVIRVGRLAIYVCASLLGIAAVAGGLTFAVILAGNIWFSTHRDVAFRALDPSIPICREDQDGGWDVLARTSGAATRNRKVGNDEWAAIDMIGPNAQMRFACSVQRHALPGYALPDGTTRSLSYDLAFLEFQESGKPYLLREPCAKSQAGCRDAGDGPVRKSLRHASQLQALFDHFDQLAKIEPTRPNYVIAFIHGWRHNAEIGDSNVGDLRHYAAHAARFLEERFASDPANKPRVTAIYLGWPGARSDETMLKRRFGLVGEWIGMLSALPTLFDRKPVSEAIAPAALSALRAVEHKIGVDKVPETLVGLPARNPNRMIVLGHSLGGNMLATGLHDDLVKKVERHVKGRYMLPPLGDLTVLINPAAEAAKWTHVQRAVWSKIAMTIGERASWKEYEDGHGYFRDEQRPILVSVTAALDWPSGGRGEADCAPIKIPNSDSENEVRQLAEERERLEAENKQLVGEGIEYDWATYDLFPAFKGDFWPLGETLIRLGSGRDPHDQCAVPRRPTWKQHWFGWIAVMLGERLRLVPFMRTDMEQTRTIGHLDPMRPVLAEAAQDGFSARPFGTSHELLGRTRTPESPPRKWCIPRTDALQGAASDKVCESNKSIVRREIPVDYDEIVSAEAGCPSAAHWLSEARDRQREKFKIRYGQRWSSDNADHQPALRFLHGFKAAGLAATTRANDPFWNMRAFDTALARHDGFMLSSFICAINQLVMDDITVAKFPVAAPTVRPQPTPSTETAAEVPLQPSLHSPVTPVAPTQQGR